MVIMAAPLLPDAAVMANAIAGITAADGQAAQANQNRHNRQQQLNVELSRCINLPVVQFQQQLVAIQQQLGTIHQLLGAMNQRLDTVDQRLDTVDQRLDTVDQRLDTMDQRLDTMDQRLELITTE